MRFLAALIGLLVIGLLLPVSAQAAWTWPLRGELISTYRNGDDPYAGGQHRGIDIAGAVGAPVVAAAGGEVRFAGTAGSSGLTVAVRTADGFDTSYLHLSSLAVREGHRVAAGETLGAVGTSGRRSAVRPHLHFGVRTAGSRHEYRNPLDFLPSPPAPPPVRAPDPHPAPMPAPVPQGPAPAPVGSRVPGPEPVPAGEPRRIPVAGRIPRRVPSGSRRPRVRPLPGHAAEPAPATAPGPVGAPAPHPVLDPGERPVQPEPGRLAHSPAAGARPEPRGLRQALGPEAGPAGGPEPAGRARPQPGAVDRGPAGRSDAGGGPDVGWILACAGLILAAALLGSTDDGRRATRSGRRRAARLLQPLTGRS